MNPRTSAGRLAVCGLLVAGLAPLSSIGSAAATSAPTSSVVGSARTATDPAGTTYTYRGTYTLDLVHELHNDWGAPDYEERAESATLTGTIPSIKMDQQEAFTDLSPTANAVQLGSVSAITKVSINSGHQVQTCKGATGTVSGMPMLRYDPATLTNLFTPFTLLSGPTKCTYTDGAAPTDGQFDFGPLTAELRASGDLLDRVGAPKITLNFDKNVGTTPLKDEALCPGYIPGGQTKSCSYGFSGVLTLELVAKNEPKQPKPPKSPSGTTLTPGAKQVRTGVLCKKKCTVTINLFPFKGGPKIKAPRVVRPKPGRTVTVKIAIPANKRALLKKAGGVTVKLTYQVAGKKHTEVRKARL